MSKKRVPIVPPPITDDERTDRASHPVEVATIEAHVDRVKAALAVWARHMAARYNAPVYLTGSTLHKPDPRDCDVRIVIADDEFAARYGNALHQTTFDEGHPYRKRHPNILGCNTVHWDEDGPTQRWIDDVAKFNAHLSSRLKLNVDMQVVPDSWWRDVWPPPFLLAAPSGRRFFHNRHFPMSDEMVEFNRKYNARPRSEGRTE